MVDPHVQMVVLRVLVLVCLAITICSTIASLATPFIVSIRKEISIETIDYNVGFVSGDQGDKTWRFNYKWVGSEKAGETVAAQSLSRTWLAMSVLWGFPILLQVVCSVYLFFHPSKAYWMLQFSFFIQACGGFGYMTRVLPLFREFLQEIAQPVKITWTLGPAGIVAVIALAFHFVTVIIYAFFSECISLNRCERD